MMKQLAAWLLALLALLPSAPGATETIPSDPALTACVHLKGALRRLHGALRDAATDEGRRTVQLALLDLYQTDKRLGCSFEAHSGDGVTAG
jgi:hypothetical protein